MEQETAEKIFSRNSVLEKKSESDFIQRYRQEGHDAGFQEGYAKGIAENKETFEKEIADLKHQNADILSTQNKLLETFNASFKQESIKVNGALQESIIQLIKKIVNSILVTQLSADFNLLRPIAESLTLFVDDAPIQLYLNKNNQEKLEKCFNTHNFEVRVDDTLTDTDYYITQNHSQLDGRLDAKIDNAIRSLFSS